MRSRISASSSFFRASCAGVGRSRRGSIIRVSLLYSAWLKNAEELIVLLLCEGIIFVIVALRAPECCAEPNRGRGIRAVDERFPIGFFLIDATFLVEHGIAVEASCYLLFHAGIGQKVSRDLFDRELIVRHVAIERLYDPIPILPDCAAAVRFISIRVGVARQVEPRPGPALSVVRRRKESVDQPFISIRTAIRHKLIDLRGRWRQSDQIEADPAE